MNYDESVRYLLTLGRELATPSHARAQKFDLRNISVLAERLGNPHRAYPCVHIAGTNGKGSTAAMLDSILRTAGLITGLYTSPHLERINERIRVNGQDISDADFAATFDCVLSCIEELLASGILPAHPTYFECLTAMAFHHFAHGCHSERSPAPQGAGRNEESLRPSSAHCHSESAAADEESAFPSPSSRTPVDFSIFEVGMGGRLDSTNIVTPEVAVITQIDFDHENFLGHSIEEIAAEKAGIIKQNGLVVSAADHPAARPVIARRAAEMDARLVELDCAWRLENVHSDAGCFRARAFPVGSGASLNLAPRLPGRFQLRNALTAAAAARLLTQRGFSITDSAIERGIASAVWPGRLERLQDRPALFLDGTHNPAGARELLRFWQEEFPASPDSDRGESCSSRAQSRDANEVSRGSRIILVYGAMRDKAVDEIAGLLFPHAATVILTQPRQPRAISAGELARLTRHLAQDLQIVEVPEEAVEEALDLASPDDAIFITGSLYLVGDIKRWWNLRTSSYARTNLSVGDRSLP